MIVRIIKYGPDFLKQSKRLPVFVCKKISKIEKLFKSNPLHPSLRLHQLKGNLNGLWSISLDMKYRIIFKRKENSDIVFVSIGKHDLYKNL